MADIKSVTSTKSRRQTLSQGTPNQVEDPKTNQELIDKTQQMQIARRKHNEVNQDESQSTNNLHRKPEQVEFNGTVSTKEEILQRKIFRAKRGDSVTPNSQNESHIQTSDNTNTKEANGDKNETKGQFKIAGSLSLNSNNSQQSNGTVPTIAPIKFNFTNPFANARPLSQQSNLATINSQTTESRNLSNTQSTQINTQTGSTSNPMFKFQVSFNNQGQANSSGTSNQSNSNNIDNFKVSQSLKAEQKFVVNKDLFSNPNIRNAPPQFNDTQSNDSQQDTLRSQRSLDENLLVQENPLNSTVSLTFQKKLSKTTQDSPQIKSLFEFKENEKFKVSEDFKPKSNFNFSTENLFGKKPTPDQQQSSDQNGNGSDRGIVLKPNFSNMTNPFKIPGSTSAIFTSGQSLFNTSNLTQQNNGVNSNNGWKPPATWMSKNNGGAQSNNSSDSKDNNDATNAEEDEKLEPDVKEKIQSNTQFEKIFQRQILKLKTQKGIGQPERKPAKKDTGFLCIEKFISSKSNEGTDASNNENRASGSDNLPLNLQPDQMHFLVFRNFLGNPQFTSVINKKVGKIKEITEKKNKFKVKVAVMVKDLERKQYETEFVEIKFINEADKNLFTRVFKQLANITDDQAQ